MDIMAIIGILLTLLCSTCTVLALKTTAVASKAACPLSSKCPALNCLFPVVPLGACCPVCSSVGKKPGKCLVTTGVGHCAEVCTGDFRCPGPQKWCSNGCEHDFDKKPGKCPVPRLAGLCAEMCTGDFSCPGPQKCCSNGCGHGCMNPVKNEKPCYYKRKLYNNGETFKDRCNMCICSNGKVACTLMACIAKPGKCPEPKIPGICILGCTSDWSCPDVQKCCSNGCGLMCMQPIGAVSSQPNCASVFCPEVYCDDQYIPRGDCCPICPPSKTLY